MKLSFQFLLALSLLVSSVTFAGGGDGNGGPNKPKDKKFKSMGVYSAKGGDGSGPKGAAKEII